MLHFMVQLAFDFLVIYAKEKQTLYQLFDTKTIKFLTKHNVCKKIHGRNFCIEFF